MEEGIKEEQNYTEQYAGIIMLRKGRVEDNEVEYRERAKNSIISLPMHIIAEAYGKYVEELRKRGLINNQMVLS